MKINIIAAMDNNGVIGVNGKIPWHIPEDMNRFKTLTTGHVVIMGRKTWESLPLKPLQDRKNIVVSANHDYIASFSCDEVYDAINHYEAIEYATFKKYEQAFIIGGSRLYEEAIPLADTVYLTKVNQSIQVNEGDEVARFPVEAWRKEKESFDLDKVEYFDGFWFETWVRK